MRFSESYGQIIHAFSKDELFQRRRAHPAAGLTIRQPMFRTPNWKPICPFSTDHESSSREKSMVDRAGCDTEAIHLSGPFSAPIAWVYFLIKQYL